MKAVLNLALPKLSIVDGFQVQKESLESWIEQCGGSDLPRKAK